MEEIYQKFAACDGKHVTIYIPHLNLMYTGFLECVEYDAHEKDDAARIYYHLSDNEEGVDLDDVTSQTSNHNIRFVIMLDFAYDEICIWYEDWCEYYIDSQWCDPCEAIPLTLPGYTDSELTIAPNQIRISELKM